MTFHYCSWYIGVWRRPLRTRLAGLFKEQFHPQNFDKNVGLIFSGIWGHPLLWLGPLVFLVESEQVCKRSDKNWIFKSNFGP